MDKITQRLFGLAAVIAAFAFLLYSTSPAIADAPQQSYATGKYQCSMAYFHSSNGKFYYNVFVLNTETGEGATYGWYTGGTFKKVSGFGTPANPI